MNNYNRLIMTIIGICYAVYRELTSLTNSLVYTHPSTAANLPCLPGSSALKSRVLTSLVPPVHNQGVSSAPNQDHMPYGNYSCRLLAHSLYVLLLTFFLPAIALFSGRFPITFRFLYFQLPWLVWIFKHSFLKYSHQPRYTVFYYFYAAIIFSGLTISLSIFWPS